MDYPLNTKSKHEYRSLHHSSNILTRKVSSYLLFNIRSHFFTLDIKNNKIWTQHDGTEVGIADELVKLGVPKEDIVLAFHEPLVREYTGFAID